MVRPVVYQPKKAFALSDAEKKRYQDIAAEIKAKKDIDAKATVAKIEAAMAACAKDAAEETPKDDINEKDADFVGFTLGGAGGGGAMVGGELGEDEECYVEEPRVIAELEDGEEDGEERSLWGDGDDEPGAEDDE